MRVSHLPYVTAEFSPLTRIRIVEYATREQAQNAVNTLSNQNLMGRLVYVREVCIWSALGTSTVTDPNIPVRTVKPNPDSSVAPRAAISVPLGAVVPLVAMVAVILAPVPAAASSMSPTFVVPLTPGLFSLPCQVVLTDGL